MRDNKIFYNRTLYTLLALLVFSWVMLFIYAYNEDGTGGEPSVMGHSWDEVACAECINVNNIQDGAVSTIKIQDGNVTTSKISNNAVTNSKIQDGAVTTGKISNNAVTNTKIQSVHWNKITGVPNDLGGGSVWDEVVPASYGCEASGWWGGRVVYGTVTVKPNGDVNIINRRFYVEYYGSDVTVGSYGYTCRTNWNKALGWTTCSCEVMDIPDIVAG